MTKNVRPVRVDGEVAFVPLTRGLVAVVDASDAAAVGQWNWTASTHPRGHAYASRNVKVGGKAHTVMLHRFLLGVQKGSMVDHIDGDGLNNRRANLRACDYSTNMGNAVVNRRNKLGLKGVHKAHDSSRYRALIRHQGHKYDLGSFATKEEAAAAYAGASRVLFGSFSRA